MPGGLRAGLGLERLTGDRRAGIDTGRASGLDAEGGELPAVRSRISRLRFMASWIQSRSASISEEFFELAPLFKLSSSLRTSSVRDFRSSFKASASIFWSLVGIEPF